MTVGGLLDAAAVLDAQAEGRTPDRAGVVAGALALDSLCLKRDIDRDIRDAAVGLRILAEGGALDLDESGRARAARLAKLIRDASIQPT